MGQTDGKFDNDRFQGHLFVGLKSSGIFRKLRSYLLVQLSMLPWSSWERRRGSCGHPSAMLTTSVPNRLCRHLCRERSWNQGNFTESLTLTNPFLTFKKSIACQPCLPGPDLSVDMSVLSWWSDFLIYYIQEDFKKELQHGRISKLHNSSGFVIQQFEPFRPVVLNRYSQCWQKPLHLTWWSWGWTWVRPLWPVLYEGQLFSNCRIAFNTLLNRGIPPV